MYLETDQIRYFQLTVTADTVVFFNLLSSLKLCLLLLHYARLREAVLTICVDIDIDEVLKDQFVDKVRVWCS